MSLCDRRRPRSRVSNAPETGRKNLLTFLSNLMSPLKDTHTVPCRMGRCTSCMCPPLFHTVADVGYAICTPILIPLKKTRNNMVLGFFPRITSGTALLWPCPDCGLPRVQPTTSLTPSISELLCHSRWHVGSIGSLNQLTSNLDLCRSILPP